jgi:hypothetical protein
MYHAESQYSKHGEMNQFIRMRDQMQLFLIRIQSQHVQTKHNSRPQDGGGYHDLSMKEYFQSFRT